MESGGSEHVKGLLLGNGRRVTIERVKLHEDILTGLTASLVQGQMIEQ